MVEYGLDTSRALPPRAEDASEQQEAGTLGQGPGLNAAGTSTVGSLALERLVHRTGWSVFV